MSKTIRGGSGLGDAIYLQAVCRHLLSKGEKLIACANYQEVFRGLNVQLAPFRKHNINILAHYSLRRKTFDSQFRDCCIQAGIEEEVELKLDWKVPRNSKYRQLGKKIAIVGLPRSPMNRDDGIGDELLPCMHAYQRMVDEAKAQGYLTVQVGAGEVLHKLQNIDVDLSNQTTVTELIDVVALSQLVICYPSFLVPLAESLNKGYITLFSQRGLDSHKIFLRHITPNKIIHRRDLGSYLIDNKDENARFLQ